MPATPTPPLISARMRSDVLAALGAYAEPATKHDLAEVQAREGALTLTARHAPGVRPRSARPAADVDVSRQCALSTLGG